MFPFHGKVLTGRLFDSQEEKVRKVQLLPLERERLDIVGSEEMQRSRVD